MLSRAPFVNGNEKKGVKIIGINFRDDEENFKEWINEHGNPFEYILSCLLYTSPSPRDIS